MVVHVFFVGLFSMLVVWIRFHRSSSLFAYVSAKERTGGICVWNDNLMMKASVSFGTDGT